MALTGTAEQTRHERDFAIAQPVRAVRLVEHARHAGQRQQQRRKLRGGPASKSSVRTACRPAIAAMLALLAGMVVSAIGPPGLA